MAQPAKSLMTDGLPNSVSSRLFDRVMCGIDGSAESFEAVRQAHRLAPDDSQFVLFGVADILAIPPAWQEPYGSALDAIHDEVCTAVHRAAQYAPGRQVTEMVFDGSPLEITNELLASEDPTLVVAGARRSSRALGIMLASLATELVHMPTRPVLLSRFRETDQVGAFPQSISVGVDGSPPSLRALESASEIGARLGCPVTAITVGDTGDLTDAPHRLGVPLVRVEGDPDEVLARSPADLVVVGSTGKSGVHALASVSERVAHHARASVLVVP